MTAGDGGTRRDVLGSYIRAKRQLADLSLRQLADMSDVSNAYLSQIERGLHQPSLKILQSIAQALELSSEVLLSEAGLLDPEPAATSVAGDVEAAILADPGLADDDKHVLLRVYRTLRQKEEAPDVRG